MHLYFLSIPDWETKLRFKVLQKKENQKDRRKGKAWKERSSISLNLKFMYWMAGWEQRRKALQLRPAKPPFSGRNLQHRAAPPKKFLTKERDQECSNCGRRPFLTTPPSSAIRGLTLVRSPMTVPSVGKPSATGAVSVDT